MLWMVSYDPILKPGEPYPGLQSAYQGRSRFLAWLYVQSYTARGYDVDVWVQPDGSLTPRHYATYMAFSFVRKL